MAAYQCSQIAEHIDGRIAKAVAERDLLLEVRSALTGGKRRPGRPPKAKGRTPRAFAELDAHLQAVRQGGR